MQIPSMINICSKTVGKLPDAYKVINNPAILIIAPINIPGILDLFFRRRLKITTTKALQKIIKLTVSEIEIKLRIVYKDSSLNRTLQIPPCMQTRNARNIHTIKGSCESIRDKGIGSSFVFKDFGLYLQIQYSICRILVSKKLSAGILWRK